MTPPESWNNLLSAYPLGLGHPDDVAHAIVYFLSDRAKWITGTDLNIDGGSKHCLNRAYYKGFSYAHNNQPWSTKPH